MALSTRPRFALIALGFVFGLGVSALLFARSKAADYDRHARAIGAIGRVRHLDRLLSEQVLAARFGLLNQYDSINATEDGLRAARRDLAARVADVVPVDDELAKRLRDLDDSCEHELAIVERFKAESSILRNSIYYLPTAAGELAPRLAERNVGRGDAGRAASAAVQRVAQTSLAYDLIGDESSGAAHAQALAELAVLRPVAAGELEAAFDLVLAHARVVGREVPAVDAWVKAVTGGDSDARLAAIEHSYAARFDEIVAASNAFRRLLYGWSLLLLVAVGLAGVQLRRVYEGLELRVTERTADLRQALAALWGEMKLARKIQEALVPAAPALGGSEIAARMKPTAEVGGDYYDVVRPRGETEWILIGDVSGHGVPAGLVMMMCHTAVRTLLGVDPDMPPDRLLSRVNRVLTETIRQLGEDKYMTISAFRRSADGTIHFSGAHQEVFVYRAATERVERMASHGVWLGLREQIDHTLDVQELKLAAGDVLLLHTDGVTEATRGDALFDTAGIERVLGEARGKSAEEIVSHVFAELEGYDLQDDATVVVLRQVA
jgi:serine phosphatase RsbU (regulator of sigma subunit)